jgi:hypothetical protein
MGILIRGLPEAEPAPEPWPVDEHTIRIDEMFARQFDIEFSAGVRGLLHHPETGVATQRGEAALSAIAAAMPALNDLKERTLAQAMGPRQRGILEPLIETRLNWAAGTLSQLAQRATVEVDDASVADRIAGLSQDAATSWHDPAYLRQLGRTAVEELRYQGERRGWEPAETETRVRGGLSDLYAGAIETAIGQDDLDGASALYDYARPAIHTVRQAAIDRYFLRAREAAVYRDVDLDMAGIPIKPAGPPSAEVFAERAAELTPDDASDAVRAGIAEVAAHAQRRAERQWHKQQSEAGVAALDWIGKNPGRSFLAIPPEIRDWLAPDQWRGLEALLVDGRLRTDGDLFERLDWQMIYQPDTFAAVDLDRHRLSLDDANHAYFAGVQRAIAEGTSDPPFVRYRHARFAADRALETKGIDTESPVAVTVRAHIRDGLHSFEAIEGHPPNGEDIAAIVAEAIERSVEEDPPATSVPERAFDSRNIVLAGGPTGGGGSRGGGGSGRDPQPPQRPAPGLGHNNPSRPLSPYEQAIENTQRLIRPSPQPGRQPMSDAAGPPAAAEQDAARERAAVHDTYRKHLRELDPGNPLLKLEPVPGVPPDKAVVESIQKEVDAIIQGKLGRFAFKNYDKYPDDKTLNGEQGNGEDVRVLQGDKAKAEADFAELSKQATPHAVFSGQHAESQTILRLPGKDMYVGYRINKDGLPTIDINSPHTGSIRFHYK